MNVSKHVAVVNHTSHPHVASDGSVYNQAMSTQDKRPHYSIVKFPNQGKYLLCSVHLVSYNNIQYWYVCMLNFSISFKPFQVFS